MSDDHGAQRLTLPQLRNWEQRGYGMFIHFGMSTFAGQEIPDGRTPCAAYAPTALDVRQWIAVARDAGMKYAVLTAKHVAGHCLWPSRHTDYHVGNSADRTHVVGAVVDACREYGVMPGLYYCSWDNHHRFGSQTPSDVWHKEALNPGIYSFTTRAYHEFQSAQLEELLTGYGDIGEVWIDIPAVLPRFYREELYHQIARWQPEAVIMMNNGFGDGSQYPEERAWPADLIAIERWLPNSQLGHQGWRQIEGKRYYLPGEVCDPIGKEWFWVEGDRPRDDRELLGMYLVCRSRNTNLLLDVPPDRSGRIPAEHVDALMRLRRNIELTGGFF